MLTLKSLKSRFVYLLIFKVNQDSLDDVILLTSSGVSFTEVQKGLIVRRGSLPCICLLAFIAQAFRLKPLLGMWPGTSTYFLGDFTKLGIHDKSLLVQAVSKSYVWEHK